MKIFYFLIILFLSSHPIASETLFGTTSEGRSIKLNTENATWEYFSGVPDGKISVKFIGFKNTRNESRCELSFEFINGTDMHFDRIQNTFFIHDKFGDKHDGYATIGSVSSKDGIRPDQKIIVDYEFRIKCKKLLFDKIEMKQLSCEQEDMKSSDASKFCRKNILYPNKIQIRMF